MSATRREAGFLEDIGRRMRGEGPKPSTTDPRAMQRLFDGADGVITMHGQVCCRYWLPVR